MEFIHFIISVVTLVGLIITHFHQRNKISSLQTAVESQKSIIEGMKSFNDIFDLNKVKDYVSIMQEQNEVITKRKIEEIKNNLESENQPMKNYFIQASVLAQKIAVYVPYSIVEEEVNKNIKDHKLNAMYVNLILNPLKERDEAMSLVGKILKPK